MGKERQSKDSEIDVLLSRLHLGQRSTDRQVSKSRRQQNVRNMHPKRVQVFQTMLLDVTPGQQMLLSGSEAIDYPMLLQISDLLRDTDGVVQATPVEDVNMKAYISLLKSCGLTAELHYTLLREWSSTTSRCLSSPVFADTEYWSKMTLLRSVRAPSLHCAILAVSALHYARLDSQEWSNRSNIQTAYRLRAQADRRLLYRHDDGVDLESELATNFCLLLFDYLTANLDEWTGRILQISVIMKRSQLSSSHPLGRLYFWLLARHDRVAAYMQGTQALISPENLLWDEEIGDTEQGVGSPVDKIGHLHAELIQILAQICRLSLKSTESGYNYAESCLTQWRLKFPISLQTYEYHGDIRDKSCFVPALTCNGGPRAIALHCLYSETMIQFLLVSPIEFQRSKIHEHTMMICKLVQSLTTSDLMLSDSLPGDVSQVAGSLFIAGQHVFSPIGKKWVTDTLRWMATVSGNMLPEKMADLLELHWREIRTRPQKIVLEEVPPDTMDAT